MRSLLLVLLVGSVIEAAKIALFVFPLSSSHVCSFLSHFFHGSVLDYAFLPIQHSENIFNKLLVVIFQVIFTNRVAEELAQDHEVVIIRPLVNPKASTLVSKHPKVSY